MRPPGFLLFYFLPRFGSLWEVRNSLTCSLCHYFMRHLNTSFLTPRVDKTRFLTCDDHGVVIFVLILPYFFSPFFLFYFHRAPLSEPSPQIWVQQAPSSSSCHLASHFSLYGFQQKTFHRGIFPGQLQRRRRLKVHAEI